MSLSIFTSKSELLLVVPRNPWGMLQECGCHLDDCSWSSTCIVCFCNHVPEWVFIVYHLLGMLDKDCSGEMDADLGYYTCPQKGSESIPFFSIFGKVFRHREHADIPGLNLSMLIRVTQNERCQTRLQCSSDPCLSRSIKLSMIRRKSEN